MHVVYDKSVLGQGAKLSEAILAVILHKLSMLTVYY